MNKKVDALLKSKKHPLTKEIQRVREIIMSASDHIEEIVKWSCPTFIYKGNIASIVMNSKRHVSIMFHKGSLLPDKSNVLEGDGKDVRTLRLADEKDIKAKAKALQGLIKEWIKLMDAGDYPK